MMVEIVSGRSGGEGWSVHVNPGVAVPVPEADSRKGGYGWEADMAVGAVSAVL